MSNWFTTRDFQLANMSTWDWFLFLGVLILITAAWGLIIRTGEEIL